MEGFQLPAPFQCRHMIIDVKGNKYLYIFIIQYLIYSYLCANIRFDGKYMTNDSPITQSFQSVTWHNSSWPGEVMWWHRSGSTLAQVMACCWRQQAISWTNVHLSRKVFCQWRSPESNFTSTLDSNPWNGNGCQGDISYCDFNSLGLSDTWVINHQWFR